MTVRRLPFALATALALAACASPAPVDVPPSDVTTASSASPPSDSAMTSTAKPPAEEIADDAPVHAGRVTFTGMVTPVKGGFVVRDVVIGDTLGDRLTAQEDVIPKDPDWFLGAKVKLTGEVVRHEAAPRQDGVIEQGREGASLAMSDAYAVELVANAVMVEGKLTRSKGLFSIGEYLVSRDDLAWSLVSSGGGKEGETVRLWGQPRTYRCAPEEQCLQGGSIPMFDVGRAEKR